MRPLTIPLIPRRVFFDNPDKTQVQLSPDGANIAYLAPVDGVLNVWVGPTDDVDAARPVTHDAGRGIRFYAWAYTNRHILYIQDQGGDEKWRLYGVDLDDGDVADLTPLEGVQARIQHLSPKFPHKILIGLNDRDVTLHDIYALDLRTGKRALLQENPGFVGFVTDDELQVRLGIRTTPEGGQEILKPVDGGWEPAIQIEMEDALTTNPIGFDRSGRTLYMADSRGRNTSALAALDLETCVPTVLAENALADLDDVMIHPTEKTVQAVAFNYERKHWQVIDDAMADDLAHLRSVSPGDVQVVSRTLDDKWWIVAFVLDDGPRRYYLYERKTKQAHFMFTDRAALDGLPLAKMHSAVIKSRDGLNLVCYYTMPPNGDDDEFSSIGMQADAPPPLVLFVHGGPWGRDGWGYDGWHQWLANRGYAVLSVNFRASTGFGKAFANAGNREWGAKMHDDLIDAVNWAVEKGIADPRRVAIMGGSYGGYATLAGLTFTPDVFACGVDIFGVSDLVTFFESVPSYWKPVIEMLTNRVGDFRTEEGREFLKSRSPLTYADHICKPLLIGQGANDARVKQAESDQIVAAMQEKNIPVTYVLYPDEGHGFARPENNLSFNAIAEAFLGERLGGRVEPVGDDFKGSGLTVPVGAEYVSGLTEALAAR
ncbi:MAG: S9 family peptidase [Anaerolineae bacterium]|nr:S9 family peptidase [Anaerolineae bacterium]